MRRLAALLLIGVLACRGADGLSGLQGERGLQGEQGPAGPVGKDGTSPTIDLAAIATQLAPIITPQLTLDILAQIPAGLQGEKGDKGDAGPAGAPGPAGATGATGATGPAGSAGVLGNVVTGGLIVRGKLCVLDGPGAVDSMCGLAKTAVSIFGLGADIAMCSNVDRSYGGGVTPFTQHCGRIGVAPEGGIRVGLNESFNMAWYDPTRRSATIGFDSDAEWSLSAVTPGYPHEYTQDVVWHMNEITKTIEIASYRPGWKFGFVTSTGLITVDKRWPVPQQ